MLVGRPVGLRSAAGVAILSLGHGLHGSLVGVRAQRARISTPRPPASSCPAISPDCC